MISSTNMVSVVWTLLPVLVSVMIHVVDCAGIQSLLLNSGRRLDNLPVVPAPINITANRRIIDLTREEIAAHLLKNGGRDSNFERPSTEFMMKVFEDLLNGIPLTEAVGHGGQQSNNRLVISDTVRSFSAKELGSPGRFSLNLPLLPRHEHLKMAELRIPVDKHLPRKQKFIISILNGRFVLKKFRVTHKFRKTDKDFVYNLSPYLTAYINRFRGNLSIIVKRKVSNTKDTDASQSSSIKSVNKIVPIVVLYSEDKEFLKTVYKSYTEDEKKNDIRDVMTIKSRTRRAASRKGRKRRKWRKNEICQLHNFKVDFDLIGWGPWIIHPKKFNAKVCYGQCPSPVGHEYSPTNHAMLQTLMRMKRPRSAPEPCCVPTKLQPLSMLYFEYDDIVVRHHQDMVAAECGCR